MYTLYTDKSENFKCNIGVEGASISNTTARLILENKDLNLLFEGKIDSEGDCIIPIKKLKNLLKEGSTGNLKLEVIADGTFFLPWEDKFKVKTHKKITVEIQKNKDKKIIIENSIKVKVNNINPQNHSLTISKLLNIKGINKTNITKNIRIVDNLVEQYVFKFNLKQPNKKFITEIIKNLK